VTIAAGSPLKDRVSGALTDETPLSPRYLGFGLYWGWMWILLSGSVLFASPAHSLQELNATRLAGIAAMALALLAIVLFEGRLPQRARQRLLLLAACILGPAGTIATVLGYELAEPVWLVASLLGWIAVGVAGACATWLWVQFFSSISVRRTSVYLSASVAVGAAVYFLVRYMQPAAALVIAAALPLASAATSRLAHGRSVPQPVESATSLKPFPALRYLFFGVLLYSVAFGLLKGISAPQDGHVLAAADKLSFLGTGIVGIALTVSILVLSSRRGLVPAYRLVLPTMVAGFLALPFTDSDMHMLASTAVTAGFQCFDILTCIVLFDVANRLHVSPLRVFGFGRCVHLGGVCLGWATSVLLFSDNTSVSQPLVMALSLGTVFLLVLTTMLFLDERDLSPLRILVDAATDTEAEETLDRRGGGNQAPGPWRQRCSDVAARHGLSPRETEVLVLLAKGHSAEYIRKTLVISAPTTKSHVYHIYRKLGVHTREELLAVIESGGNLARSR